MRWVALLLLLWPATAFGQKYPSEPVTIVGPQGRPIPNGTVTVQNEATGASVTVFTDDGGGTQFNGIVPANGIVQFYADPGRYRVTVSGAGVIKQYETTVTVPVTSSTPSNTIGIQRPAYTIRVDQTDSPAKVCPTSGSACSLSFLAAPSANQCVNVDWTMPSFSLMHVTTYLAWNASVSDADKQVTWRLRWCKNAVGASSCTPTGNQVIVSPNTYTTVNTRTQLTLATPSDWSTSWGTREKINVELCRLFNDPNDTYGSTVNFTDLDMEFTR